MSFTSDASIERIALQAIADGVSEARKSLSVASLVGIEPSLATSLWQKAIRRGHVEWALRAAIGIHQRDPDYTWRRLRIVALEEVSVADLVLVSQVLAIAGKRNLRASLGNLDVLGYFVTRLALSAKCRTPCDMLSWLDPVDGPAPSDAKLASTERMASGDLDAIRGVAAVWRDLAPQSVRVAGRWVTTGRRDPWRRDALLEQIDAPPILRYVVRKGHGTYALNALSAPAFQLASVHRAWRTYRDPHPESLELIAGIPAYAYCMYSAPGREALRRWLRHEGRHLDDHLQAKDRLGLLGNLLFYVEGDFCARRLDIAHGAAIEYASECALLQRYGVRPEQVPAFKQAVQASLASINVMRRQVMEID